MKLCRLVDDGTLWLKAIADSTPVEQLVPEAVNSFVPSPKDKYWLSLYGVENETDLELVAAALRYNQGDIKACHFVAVEQSALVSAKLEVKKTDGLTYHPNINSMHYELHVPSTDALMRTLKIFASGTCIRIEQPTVKARLGKSAADDEINFEAVLEKINGNVATRTLELVKDKHLTLSPGGV